MNKFGIRLTPSSILLSALFLPVIHQNINPYIDPGTGSLILQVLIASFLGGIFIIKVFWKKIKLFFRNLFTRGRRGVG